MIASGPVTTIRRAFVCRARRTIQQLTIAVLIACAIITSPAAPVAATAPTKATVCGLTADETRAFRAADIVLIGEIHDNPAHHTKQACLVDAFATSKATDAPDAATTPTLVWEHIDATQAPALTAYLNTANPTAAGLANAVGWQKTGWPSWDMFAPIAEAALQNKLPMASGDAPRTQVRAVARGGLKALASDTIARIGLDSALPAPLQRDLLDELAASHCGLIPAEAFVTMADAQRYRDASLADALVTAMRKSGSAILVAGNGHVRSDRGVPWHLKRMAPNAEVFVVAQAETGDSAGYPNADATLTSERVDRTDPCIAMRKAFEARRSGKSSGAAKD
ncbi:MAG: ChaN family lipoprotein [Pseudomonadota bacterium]